LKFEADNTESLTKSAATGGDRTKATLSLWCKRTELTNSEQVILFLTGVNGNKYTSLGWGTGDEINFHYYNAGIYPYNFLTDRVFRDMSAWYHIVVAVDTTQSTASNRVKFYVNGVQETSFSTEDYPDQNIDTPFNNDSATYPMEIGNDTVFSMGGEALSGYLADYYLIDGQQLAPTEFGEFDEDSGIWIPKAYTGTFGSNGFYLDFADASDLGDDESGNGNDFTEVNITSADQATDTPTNNFATTNPLPRYFTETFTTEGATVVTKNANGWIAPQSTICPASGKWYMEFKFNAPDSRILGAAPIGGTLWDSATHYGGTVGSDSVGYDSTGYLYVNDSGINPTYGPSYDSSNIIAIALDMDNGYIYWAKDNTWINTADPVAGSGGYALPAGLVEHSIGASVYQQAKQSFANFGGYTTISISTPATDANGYGTFEYAPPSGYYALCTKNLAEFG
jgi:hypothetical protein